jgi:hypothetical protein
VRIQTVHLDDNELPRLIDATLTMREAAMITKAFGRLSPNAAREQGFDPEITSTVYDKLTGVFNAFYEDGVDGYLKADR